MPQDPIDFSNVSAGSSTLAAKSSIRFTPDELRELKDEFTESDIARMHPADQLSLEFIRKAEFQTPIGPMALGMGGGQTMSAPRTASGLADAAAPSTIGTMANAAWKGAGPLIGGVVGTGLGTMVGHPILGGMAGSRIGGRLVGAPPRPPKAPPKPPVTRTGPPFADRQSTLPEVMENVPRGVQNDFKGPVGIERPVKLGPTHRDSADDLMERVLGGGVQNDFKGRVSFQPGSSTRPKIENGNYEKWLADLEAQNPQMSLEDLISALGRSLARDRR